LVFFTIAYVDVDSVGVIGRDNNGELVVVSTRSVVESFSPLIDDDDGDN
jgi:hypothetical protein